MSRTVDPTAAGREAARTACAALGGRPPDLVLVFATTGYDQARVIAGVRAEVGGATIAGSSGEGVIALGVSDERERVVGVLAIASSTLRFAVHSAADYGRDSRGAGERLAAEIRATDRGDTLGVLLFIDGLFGNCTEFLATLEAGLPGVPLVGGTAGDAMTFERTFQYAGEHVLSGAAVAVVIAGAGSLGISVSHGCSPLGLERRVTRAADGWVHEIDHRPAWSVFKEYLDGDPVDLNAEGIVHLCIGQIADRNAREPYIIHTPLRLDSETGALFFPGGGLRDGDSIRLTRRDPAKIRHSARTCAEVLARPGQTPAFVLQFDCAGRGQILFGTTAGDEIVKPLQAVLGAEHAWLGVHTYGEIAPIEGKHHYHNYTVVLCAVFD